MRSLSFIFYLSILCRSVCIRSGVAIPASPEKLPSTLVFLWFICGKDRFVRHVSDGIGLARNCYLPTISPSGFSTFIIIFVIVIRSRFYEYIRSFNASKDYTVKQNKPFHWNSDFSSCELVPMCLLGSAYEWVKGVRNDDEDGRRWWWRWWWENHSRDVTTGKGIQSQTA